MTPLHNGVRPAEIQVRAARTGDNVSGMHLYQIYG